MKTNLILLFAIIVGFIWGCKDKDSDPAPQVNTGPEITEPTTTQQAATTGSNMVVAIDRPRGVPYIAWGYEDGAIKKIKVAKWTGTQWTQLGEGLVAEANKVAFAPTITVDKEGKPIVAWTESSSMNVQEGKIYARRWNGSSWEALGGVIGDIGTWRYGPKVTTDAEGNPITMVYKYLAKKVEVFRYTGGTWTLVGQSISSTHYDDKIPPDIDILSTNNTIYISYHDKGTSLVRKLEGNQWVLLGTTVNSPNCSSGGPSLAVGTDGTLYAAMSELEHKEGADGQREVVGTYQTRAFKWTGSSWEKIGTLTTVRGEIVKLFFGLGNDLRAAYTDRKEVYGDSFVHTKVFSNGSWKEYGTPFETRWFDLDYDGAGNAWVSYGVSIKKLPTN